MVVKTFRGQLADGGQDRIRLQTIKGKVGYRIVKFQIVSKAPVANSPEAVIKIYKTLQSTVDYAINFTDSDLLASAFYENNSSIAAEGDNIIIFDNEVFNQDIYVTVASSDGGINYYLELEVIPLDDAGAEYTTLKDMRQPG